MADLTPKQRKLLDLSADNADDIEADVEEKAAETARIINDVMTNPDAQDQEIFEALGVPLGTTVQDLSQVPVIDRDETWQSAFTGLVVAARMTAYIDTQGIDLLRLSEEHNRRMEKQAASMSRSELKAAGKAGVRKDDRKAAKERRDGRRSK